MNLLLAGADVAVIAMWLGHQTTESPTPTCAADVTIEQTATDRTQHPAPDVQPGTYSRAPRLLSWLQAPDSADLAT